jgi:L-threonylcarbamoyladenylate synthase
MEIVAPTPSGIARAADALRHGGIVAYPSETVYGLGVDPFSDQALDALFAVKGRDAGTPVLMIVSNLDQLTEIVDTVSPRAEAYAKAFWPGPLSLLFPGASRLPEALRGEDGCVCVRWTSSESAAALCDAFGGAIVSTSANKTGDAPAMSADAIDPVGIAVCLDGGTLAPSLPSTVLDPETGEVLREGAIGRDALDRVQHP